MREAGTARGSRSPSHPGLMRGSASSFISRARLCAGSALATAVTYLASASDRLAASLASLPPTPPPSLGSFSRMGFFLASPSAFSPDFSPTSEAPSASDAATASAYSARSSASSTSSSSGKSSSGSGTSAADRSEAWPALSPSPGPLDVFFFPSAERTASARIFLESDAISTLSLASSLAHCSLAAVTASRSLAVSLPSTAAYLSAKAVLRLAASTASLPMTA
mmetsp:Transcript_4902/g.20190  ORF Transcript_4902/g.20190 Transcript_4902/m.20190 type:complete len:223 (+) Transcript_4902:1149-1817(+)